MNQPSLTKHFLTNHHRPTTIVCTETTGFCGVPPAPATTHAGQVWPRPVAVLSQNSPRGASHGPDSETTDSEPANVYEYHNSLE